MDPGSTNDNLGSDLQTQSGNVMHIMVDPEATPCDLKQHHDHEPPVEKMSNKSGYSDQAENVKESKGEEFEAEEYVCTTDSSRSRDVSDDETGSVAR